MKCGRSYIIATVNFKGGVGKTTIVWLLALYASQRGQEGVLVIDADAQMSLTTAVELSDTSGGWFSNEFERWYEEHKRRKKTLFHAIEAFTAPRRGQYFEFPIDQFVAFKSKERLWFIPSTPNLYWLTLEVFDREQMRFFVDAFLQKLRYSKRYPPHRFVFFDCPPSFNYLSYSVLVNCDLLLVPVNPDVFAAKGLGIMLEGLKLQIEPHPMPKVAVFMNKAKLYKGNFTRETALFWDEVRRECKRWQAEGLDIRALTTFVPERADIKRSIQKRGKLPPELENYIVRLWREIKTFLEG